MRATAIRKLGFLLGVAVLATGRSNAAESARLAEVQHALEERIPQVAATKAEELEPVRT